jgi:hypothetical protein
LSGIGFDVRGLINLDQIKSVTIPLNRPCRRVHFLHAANRDAFMAITGIYGVTYTTGELVDLDSGVPPPMVRLPAVQGNVTAAAADGQGGWYIAGAFGYVGGIERNNLAHVLADGTVDPAWDPSPNGTNAVLVLARDRLYIGGQPCKCLAALDPQTGQASDWDPEVIGKTPRVTSLAFSGDTVFVGGSFTHVSGTPRNSLAALDRLSGAAFHVDRRRVPQPIGRPVGRVRPQRRLGSRCRWRGPHLGGHSGSRLCRG